MNVNIIGNTVPTSFDIACSNCAWTGVLTTPQLHEFTITSVARTTPDRFSEDAVSVR